MQEPEKHIPPLNRVKNLKNSSSPCRVGDIQAQLTTDSNFSITLEEALDIAKKYIEGGYVVLESEKEPDTGTKIREVNISKFKKDHGIKEDFAPSKNLREIKTRRLTHEVSRWLRDQRDIIAAIIDIESDFNKLYSYDSASSTWKADGKQKMREILEEQLEERHTVRLENNCAGKLQGYKPVSFNRFGAEEPYIAVQNGLLDLSEADPNIKEEKPELREIEKEDHIINKLPVKYDPKVDVPKLWRQYLKDSVPNSEQIKKLQEFAGYCLRHWAADYEKALMLLGPTDTGKSVFLDVMNVLLGGDHQSNNVANESLKDLADSRWSVAQLQGKIANIRHDLDPASIENVGKVKELTGGKPMTAERKREQKFELEPKAKHLFSANRVPDTSKDDDAYYNRWLTVIFPETVPEEEQDKKLKDKLTTEKNLTGILNWAIIGYRRLQAQDKFTGQLDPMATKQLWQEWGNSVERFVSRYCDVYRRKQPSVDEKTDWKVQTSTIYPLYEKFATQSGLEVVTKKQFTQRIQKVPGVSSTHVRVQGSRGRGYKGIKLTENAAKRIEEDYDR